MGIESGHQKKVAPTAEEYMQIEKNINTQQQSLATAEIGDMDSTLEKIDSLEEERVEAYESGRAEAEIENERFDAEKAAQEAQRLARIDGEISATREQFKTGGLSREKLGELVAQLKVLEAEKNTAPKAVNQESVSIPQEEARVEVAPVASEVQTTKNADNEAPLESNTKPEASFEAMDTKELKSLLSETESEKMKILQSAVEENLQEQKEISRPLIRKIEDFISQHKSYEDRGIVSSLRPIAEIGPGLFAQDITTLMKSQASPFQKLTVDILSSNELITPSDLQKFNALLESQDKLWEAAKESEQYKELDRKADEIKVALSRK